MCITASPHCWQWSHGGSSSDLNCPCSLQRSTLLMLRHAAPFPAGGQSPHSRATRAWSVGSTLWRAHQPGGEGWGDQGSDFQLEDALEQCHYLGNDKPPFSWLLTFQTDNDPAGKATPLYAARRPHRQSRPDEAAPSPRMSEDTTHIFSQYLFFGQSLTFSSQNIQLCFKTTELTTWQPVDRSIIVFHFVNAANDKHMQEARWEVRQAQMHLPTVTVQRACAHYCLVPPDVSPDKKHFFHSCYLNSDLLLN